MGAVSEKIADEELRRLASEQPPDATTVIVEVEVPPPRMKMQPGRGLGRQVLAFEPESDEERAHADEAVSSVRTLLEEVASEPPVWLAASSAFVATLLPRDLVSLAASPFVRAIHPNALRR